MRLVPRDTSKAISFFQVRVPPWLEHAAEIGTDAATVEALQAKVDAARAAVLAQRQTQAAARAATATLRHAMEALNGAGAAIVQQIRAKATSGGHNVYSLALIPAPAAGSPIAEPGKPTNFSFQLRQQGMLLLKWDCPNPRGSVGTIYQVSRKIGPWGAPGPFVHLGSSGVKKFLDATVPAGSGEVTYRVVAMRSTKRGPAAEYILSLGVSGGRVPGGGVGGVASNVLQTRRLAA